MKTLLIMAACIAGGTLLAIVLRPPDAQPPVTTAPQPEAHRELVEVLTVPPRECADGGEVRYYQPKKLDMVPGVLFRPQPRSIDQ